MTHLLQSLESAARLVVIQDGFDLNHLNLTRWATTYRCSVDDVLEAIHLAQNGKRKLPEETAASSPPAIQTEENEG